MSVREREWFPWKRVVSPCCLVPINMSSNFSHTSCLSVQQRMCGLPYFNAVCKRSCCRGVITAKNPHRVASSPHRETRLSTITIASILGDKSVRVCVNVCVYPSSVSCQGAPEASCVLVLSDIRERPVFWSGQLLRRTAWQLKGPLVG